MTARETGLAALPSRTKARIAHSMSFARRLTAEALGTGFLLATVVGSGIMAEALAGGNVAIALLGNTIPTGAILYVLITAFGPISGAHFNPAVTLAFWMRGDIGGRDAVAYAGVQILAGIAGVITAHAMFDLPFIELSTKTRSGTGQWIAEFIATFGLLATIFATLKARADAVAAAVGLYITSFANPAVTIARSLSDTFAGIAPAGAPAFIVAQLVAAAVAVPVFRWLLR